MSGHLRYLTEAERLGRELISRSEADESGPVRPGVPGDPCHPDRLFDGSSGVGFFLAALHRACPEGEFREPALEALRPLRQLIQEGSAIQAPLGVGLGLGGWVYALARTGLWLDLPELMKDAQELAASLLPERIREDAELDVIGGAAGAILGLLVLYRESGDQAALAAAARCGEHLLDRREPSAEDQRAWPGMLPRPVSGFSHGAAGIALALVRLFRATGDTRFLSAAREAVAWERGLWCAQARNWRPFHPAPDQEPPPFRVTWCHGAPGIGLARLGCLPELEAAHARAEVETAVETTRAFHGPGPDHLCCGTMGRVELLLTAGRQLDKPEWTDAGHALALQTIREARAEGGYLLDVEDPSRALHAGLFQGVSGIGYQLLRLGEPERFPSLLLLE